ncbi:uncharacterized protein LOC143264884 isoform X3 [Megachile rotundata]|uniref:uncharacterized protein LOC143264884 isoform X3 n=1 Tax=Megachile rotundata TaxID=143995 RepID=UPI003FD06E6F
MNDERPSGIVSGSGASASDDAEELGVQGPANSNAKNLKPSVSNITRKIRSKLPNVGRYLKRLRLRNGKLRVEKETIDGSSVAVAQNIVNEVSESSSGEYQTGNQTMNPTSSTLVETEPIRMISISMNTSETDGLFVTTLNRENIAARNILEFREALANPLGRPTERLRDQEPRTVPLVRIRSEDRHERYLQDNVNGESGFSRSSTIGSEISSTSDGEQPEMRNQRIGQDHTPQLYNNFLGANSVIRKPLNHQDDEPSIY